MQSLHTLSTLIKASYPVSIYSFLKPLKELTQRNCPTPKLGAWIGRARYDLSLRMLAMDWHLALSADLWRHLLNSGESTHSAHQRCDIRVTLHPGWTLSPWLLTKSYFKTAFTRFYKRKHQHHFNHYTKYIHRTNYINSNLWHCTV